MALHEFPSYKTLMDLKRERRALFKRSRELCWSFKREEGDEWFHFHHSMWPSKTEDENFKAGQNLTDDYHDLQQRIVVAQVAFDVDKFQHMTALWARLRERYAA